MEDNYPKYFSEMAFHREPTVLNQNGPYSQCYEKFENFQSFERTKKMNDYQSFFSFNYVEKKMIITGIQNLNKRKACQNTDVPAKTIKQKIDTFGQLVSTFLKSLSTVLAIQICSRCYP